MVTFSYKCVYISTCFLGQETEQSNYLQFMVISSAGEKGGGHPALASLPQNDQLAFSFYNGCTPHPLLM